MQLAQFVSDMFEPILMLTFAALFWETDNFAVLTACAAIFFAIIPFWIYGRTKTRFGTVGRIRLKTQSEFVASIIVGFVLLFVFGAPKTALAYAVVLSIGQIIVLAFVPVWKISGHAFGMSTSLFFLTYINAIPWYAAFTALAILGWGRTYVKAHTPAQYLTGSICGIILSLIASAAL